MRALGRSRQAKGRQYYKGDVNLPAFLTAQNLKPFVSSVLEVTSSQIEFRPTIGGKAFGYLDKLLPEVCDVSKTGNERGVIGLSRRRNRLTEPAAKEDSNRDSKGQRFRIIDSVNVNRNLVDRAGTSYILQATKKPSIRPKNGGRGCFVMSERLHEWLTHGSVVIHS